MEHGADAGVPAKRLRQVRFRDVLPSRASAISTSHIRGLETRASERHGNRTGEHLSWMVADRVGGRAGVGSSQARTHAYIPSPSGASRSCVATASYGGRYATDKGVSLLCGDRPGRRSEMQALRQRFARACYAGLIAVTASQVGAVQRSTAERLAFVREHPCPSTGSRRGACPGWQVDHIVPLCAGGLDKPENMHWLAIDDHRFKTHVDVRECRKLRRAAATPAP
jgi:hypothetical protein